MIGKARLSILQRRRVDVLMLGLENSGKTTILYKILTGDNVLPVPTFGFNMEVLPFNDIELDVMDVGGCDKLVPLWKHYLITASAIIYVVDCSDVKRMEENKALLSDIVTRPERKGIPILVIVNKADNVYFNLKADDLRMRLDLQNICKTCKYKVQMVSAETGDGLTEAFTWLCAALGSGHACKKLKRIREKQARQERETINKKRRRRELGSNETLSEHFDVLNADEIKPVNETSKLVASNEPETSNLGETGRTWSQASIGSRVFSFSESYVKINAFFKSRVSEIENIMSGVRSPPITPNLTEGSKRKAGLHSAEQAYVDTFSSEPHSPVSPRSGGSLLMQQEFMQKRDALKTVAVEAKPEANSETEEKAESQAEETNFEKLVRFFNRNPPPPPTQTNNNPHAASSGAGLRYHKIPHSSRVISRRRIQSANLAKESATDANMEEDLKSRARSRSSGAAQMQETSSSGAFLTNQHPVEDAKEDEVRTPFSGFFAVLASIRLSLSGKRRGGFSTKEATRNGSIHMKENVDIKADEEKHQRSVRRDKVTAKPWLPLIQIQPPEENQVES